MKIRKGHLHGQPLIGIYVRVCACMAASETNAFTHEFALNISFVNYLWIQHTHTYTSVYTRMHTKTLDRRCQPKAQHTRYTKICCLSAILDRYKQTNMTNETKRNEMKRSKQNRWIQIYKFPFSFPFPNLFDG